MTLAAVLSRAEPWQQAWVGSKNDALLFAEGVLGAVLEPWQRDALVNISKHDRVSIRSGHGVGKTTLLAICALWFLCTRQDCKIPITANSQDQLRDTIWPEIAKWHRRLPEPLRLMVEVAAERVFMKNAPDAAFAVQRTASKERPEALQGFHADHILFLVDEASGIADIVFEVGSGALSTPGAKALLAGNPTRSNGFFYDTHHRLGDRWKTMRVNSEDVPRARGHIDDIIARYGKESNAYRVRVLGEFPTSDDEAVISLESVQAAVDRKVEKLDWMPVWGLDVARFGDDRTCLAKRQANRLLEPVASWHGHDLMQTVGRVLREYEDTPDEDKPAEIMVDVIGLGAGVVDRGNESRLPVRGVNVGEVAAGRAQYQRLRDELWFRGRDWFADKTVSIPDDRKLISELTAPLYTFTSSGKILVESKDELKRRGFRSPDLADAFLLTFAGGLQRPNRSPRGWRKRLGLKSAWSA